MQRQKDTIGVEELKKYKSFIIGFRSPIKEQPGFVSYFGITRLEHREGFLVLLDEFESHDVLVLVEQLKWLMVKFHFRIGTYREAGDFIFGDLGLLDDLLTGYSKSIEQSNILYGQDEQKPFLTLLPEMWRLRKSGVITISDESTLSFQLKDEKLQSPALVQFGDSPALESLLFAYHGWQELIRITDKGPQQTEVIHEIDILGDF